MFNGAVRSVVIASTIGVVCVASGCASNSGAKATSIPAKLVSTGGNPEPFELTDPMTLDATPPPSWPAEIPNIGDLKLNVVKADVEDRISTSGGRRTLTAKDGYKLVVVTLAGQVVAPCCCTFDTRDFSAVYQDDSKPKDEGPNTDIIHSAGIANGDLWDIATEGEVVTWQFDQPENLTLRVAFTLPKNVKTFAMRCPTTAKNLVNLPKN